MTRRFAIGVIGGGYGQHVQVPAFRNDDRAHVHGLCTSTQDRAQAIADRLSIPRAYGDWRQLVHDPAIDVVAVSVPPGLQAEVVVAAAQAGKHIFAEKPLAMNAADAERMVEAVREAKVVATVDFEFRELDGWLRLRSMLADRKIGTVRHVYFSWRIETFAHRENKLNWKRDFSAGGGALNLFGSHALDSILWTFGKVDRVAAHLFCPHPETSDARVEAWLHTADGANVSLSIAADAPFGTGYRVEVYGDDGALILENRTADYASGYTLHLGLRGGVMTPIELPPPPAKTDGRIAATGSLVHRFMDAIERHAAISPDLTDGLLVQHLIDAIRRANGSGSWQTLS